MQVIVLCGGLGTRLGEETDLRPKPMVEIGGRPILWHIMKLYSHHGFKDFILCLGYRGDLVRSYFLNYGAMHGDTRVQLGSGQIEQLEALGDEREWRVTLAETGPLTPSGGRIARVSPYLEGERFMVTYGDGVSNVDLRRLLEYHYSHGKLATVTGVRPSARFGELRITGDLVTEFREKPQVAEGWISAGFFVFERRVLDYLGPDSMLEGVPLERLAAERQLAVYRHDGYWHAMDTLRDKRALEEDWATGQAGWKVW